MFYYFYIIHWRNKLDHTKLFCPPINALMLTLSLRKIIIHKNLIGGTLYVHFLNLYLSHP